MVGRFDLGRIVARREGPCRTPVGFQEQWRDPEVLSIMRNPSSAELVEQHEQNVIPFAIPERIRLHAQTPWHQPIRLPAGQGEQQRSG